MTTDRCDHHCVRLMRAHPTIPSGAFLAMHYWMCDGAFDYHARRGRIVSRRIGRRTIHANNHLRARGC